MYNLTVEKLRSHNGKTPNWMQYWKDVVAPELPEWCGDIPFQIKKIAVRDAIFALRVGKKNVKFGNVARFDLHFRSRKTPKQSCFIPASAIKKSGIYPMVSGKGLRYAEELPPTVRDSRLVFVAGRFYLAVTTTERRAVAENQGRRVVSVDPGVRCFNTFYSQNVAGFVGKDDFSRIFRLLMHLDDLLSRTASAGTQKKRRMLLAASRLRMKVRNLIDELHHKAARFYVDNFDVIIIPKFEAGRMSRKLKRKIRKKTVRAMLSFSHSRFLSFLKHKAYENGKIVLIVSEEFTSKTNPLNGELMNVGSKRTVSVGGTKIDRDLLGAFNIMLKALVDLPGMLNAAAVNAC